MLVPQPQALKNQGTTKKRQELDNFYQRGMENYQTRKAQVYTMSLGKESFSYGSYKKIQLGDTDEESEEIKQEDGPLFRC